MPQKTSWEIFFENYYFMIDVCHTLQCDNALHNVYMRDYDSPVYKIALYLLQGNNRISMYIRRILAIPLVKSVVATGEYLRENHEFRV